MNTFVVFCSLVTIFYVIVTLFSFSRNEKIDNLLIFNSMMFFILFMTGFFGQLLGDMYGPVVGTGFAITLCIALGSLLGIISIRFLVEKNEEQPLLLLISGLVLGILAGGGAAFFGSFSAGRQALGYHFLVFIIAMISSCLFDFAGRKFTERRKYFKNPKSY